MFSAIKRMTGFITVEETDREIIVEGIPSYFIVNDIGKIWRTSKIAGFMFNKVTRNSFRFDKFFAIDILYILQRIAYSKERTNFSKRTASQLIEQLLENTWLRDTVGRQPDILDFSKVNLFYKTPLIFQEEFLKKYNEVVPKYHLNGYMLAGAPGSGKAQSLDSLIKIPGGWKRMGDIAVGDIITAKDGTSTSVTAVYPQGTIDLYKITFADGRSTECCGEHLWKITRVRGGNHQSTEIANTNKILEYLNSKWLHNRVYIDLVDSEDIPDVDLEIDPYLLGAYLGDGSSRGNLTSEYTRPSITTPDEFIIEELLKVIPEDTRIVKRPQWRDKCPDYYILGKIPGNNSFVRFLKNKGLFAKYSYEKHIPTEYLHASTKQRLHLLQGLMDTDGTIGTQGTSSYCTTSYQLALEVQYLVRSLGGIAKIGTKYPHFTYLGEKKMGRVAYNVNIRYKKPSELFRLPKKKDRTNDNGQYCEYLKLKIKSIEPIGKKEAKCISISHPDRLYVTDDFIVTHNTVMGMMLAECRRADFIMVVCPNNAVHRVWKSSIENEYKDPPTYWIAGEDKPYNNQRYLVAHYEALYKLLEVAKNVRGRIVIILDESHNLNEVNSQRTQNFIQLCKLTRSRDIIWASGTPIKALGSESIPFFTTIDPFFTDVIKEKFKKIYGKDATKSIDILSNRINLTSHKIEKKELKLADPIIENFPVVIPNGEEFTLDSIKKDMVVFIEERNRYYAGRKQQDYQFYDKCIDYFENSINNKNLLSELQTYKRYVGIVKRTQLRDCKDEVIYCNRFENTEIMPVLPVEWRKDFKDVKSVVKYVALKIQGECLGRVLGKKRMDCIAALSQSVDYIKYIESTVKKTLIFTSYVEVIEKTKEKLLSIGLNPLVVYAKTNKDLNDIITRFDKDESLNPLVATFASLSTAVPLVMADTMIMLNTPFRDYVHQQAISRIHRLGSDTQVYVYIAYLDTGTKPNLSTRTVDILKWSQTAVEAIMGIKSPFEIEELNVSAESINNRPSYYDIGVNMVELGIEERFEFETYVQESKGRPGYLNW